MESDKPFVRDIVIDDIDDIVEVHRQCFPDTKSIFSVLDRDIVKSYYAQFVREPESLGAVLVDSVTNRVVGYAVGTLKAGFHKRFLLRYFFPLCLSVVKGLFTSSKVRHIAWKHFREIHITLTRQRQRLFAKAEGSKPDGSIGFFMPIAVLSNYRGGGNAKRLAEYFTDQFFKRGISRVRGNGISLENIPSRKLFEGLGWSSKVVSEEWVAVWIDNPEYAIKNNVRREEISGKFIKREMSLSDIDEVVEIYNNCFYDSVNVALGNKFVKLFCAQAVEEKESVAVVIEDPISAKVIAAAAGTLEPGFTFRLIRRHIIVTFLSVLRSFFCKKIVREKVLKYLISLLTLNYFKKIKPIRTDDGQTLPPGTKLTYLYVGVHPKWRRIGGGKEVLTFLVDKMFQLGADRVCGCVDSNNTASIKLHEQLGWKMKRTSDKWFTVWIDRV